MKNFKIFRKFSKSFVNITNFARFYRYGLLEHNRVFSHTTYAERLALFHLARSLPKSARALEIGSYTGSSTLFLCAGLRHINGSIICVDTWMNDAMLEVRRDTFEEFKNNTKNYSNMINTVRKLSTALLAEDIKEQLDFVFIDGDHSESCVRHDFNLISHFVKFNGIVAFHDLRPKYPGVGVVVGEALATRQWQLMRLIDSTAIMRKCIV